MSLTAQGPSRTKNATETKLSTGSKFATTIAKQYRECSGKLVYLGKRGMKRVQIVRNYGGSKRLYGFGHYGRVPWAVFVHSFLLFPPSPTPPHPKTIHFPEYWLFLLPQNSFFHYDSGNSTSRDCSQGSGPETVATQALRPENAASLKTQKRRDLYSAPRKISQRFSAILSATSPDFSATSAVKLAILLFAIRKCSDFTAIAILWDAKHTRHKGPSLKNGATKIGGLACKECRKIAQCDCYSNRQLQMTSDLRQRDPSQHSSTY